MEVGKQPDDETRLRQSSSSRRSTLKWELMLSLAVCRQNYYDKHLLHSNDLMYS